VDFKIQIINGYKLIRS